MCLLPTDGNELLRLVVVETAVAAHLDVDKDIGVRQLGHQQGVLTNHDRTDAREHRIVVEVEVVGNQVVEQLLRQRFAALATLGELMLLLPLGLVVVPAHVDAH